MLAEALAPELDGELPRDVPALRPTLVVDVDEAEAMVRASRAQVAVLSLQVRDASEPLPAAPVESVGAAEVLLRSSLDQRLAARRLEISDELERTRTEAAALVASARTEAASIVSDATAETVQILLRGIRPPTTLRVVTERLAPAVAPHPAGSTGVQLEASPDDGPDRSPDLPTQGRSALEGSVTRAVSAALAEVFAAGHPVGVSAGAGLPAAEPASAGPTLTVARSSEPAGVPVQSGHGRLTAGQGGSRVARVLYADVILPMVAVVIVLVILLAWVG
ncbi:MAG: hypothetical protein ACRDYW_03030 [Acidimicrobiales bacterium]